MKIEIATPMYGGQCFSGYHESILQLVFEGSRRGHLFSFNTMSNESLIQRARNSQASKFLLRGEADILLFIDSDIRFDAKNMLDMIEEDKDVIGGITPLKTINFPEIVNSSIVNESYDNLHKYGGYYNINQTITDEMIDDILNDRSFEVKRIGTGVMSIKRNVFEKLSEVVEKYIEDNPLGLKEERFNFFPVTIQYDANWGGEGANRMMSEDYNFCNLWKEEGGKIYAKAGIVSSHSGFYEYSADLKEQLKVVQKIKEKEKNK